MDNDKSNLIGLRVELDSLIFESGSVENFESTLEQLIEKLEISSDIEKGKLIATYQWMYISISNSSSIGDFKHIFLKNYRKFLHESLPKSKQISYSGNKYAVEEAIMTVPKSMLDEFSRTILKFDDLNKLKMLEMDIKRLLFFPLNRVLIEPFIKKDLVDKYKIQDLFNIVSEYYNSEGIIKRTSFKETCAFLTIYQADIERYNSFIAENYIKQLILKLESLIKIDFGDSYENKPALIEVIGTDKKYPFHKRETKIPIELIVNNFGDGPAYDFRLKVINQSDSITVEKKEFYFGNIEKGQLTIELNVQNDRISSAIFLEIECEWKDIGESNYTKKLKVDLSGQRSNIDWTKLSKNKPYNLEPISNEAHLIGRLDILNQLTSNINSNNIESYILYGQKRTGKTSIVKTYSSIINNVGDKFVAVSYIDGGDIAYPEVVDVISQFGKKLCQCLINLDKRFNHLEIPDFNGALAPIDDFLTKIVDLMPEIKMVFAIDEFDEFSRELYKGKYADSFFQTIRSISSKANFGFILVGGEKMQIIKKEQGHRLNKFKIEKVNYFDKENNYTNFIKLVRKPVDNVLEYSDESIALLHEYTSGNPYFTKFICVKLVEIMVKLQDSSITIKEVKEAINYALAVVESNSFHHFWMDGVLAEPGLQDQTLEDRRKILLSLIEALRNGDASKDNLIKIAEELYFMKSVISDSVIRDFTRREVFIKEDNQIRCNVKFFEKWLVNKGVHEIIAGSSSMDSIFMDRLIQEEDFVQSKEVVEVAKNLGTYKGISTSEDLIRSWLNQFGDNSNQRLAFKLLKGVKFYKYSFIRERLESSFDLIQRKLINKSQIDKGESTRKDILVSYLDEPSKSGAHYAKLFGDENKIYFKNVVAKDKILSRLTAEEMKKVEGLIFVDDFIGTGRSIRTFLNELAENIDLLQFINENEISLFVVAISGYNSAKDKILKDVKIFNHLNIHICDVLDETDRAFSDENKIFNSSGERLKAKDLAFKFGKILERDHPLGYSDSQSLVVFDTSCPNNTLPIFWKDKKDWNPLFKRN